MLPWLIGLIGSRREREFVVRRLQIQRSAKIPTMGCTWRTAHCREFLLAAVDAALSQQINTPPR